MISGPDRYCGCTGRREGRGFHVEIFTFSPLHVNKLLVLVLGWLAKTFLDVLIGWLIVCLGLGRYKELEGREK